ncbi:MAG: ABC transporter ATP-binding protein [Bowdeniella nasicola]|nr:ABC transporter ATP-binding protein [Bowdeniella nasicola]
MNPPALLANSVTKIYGEPPADVTALDNVSLRVDTGRFTAIMGPSGAGKSTLVHLFAGIDLPTSGQVYVNGIDVTDLSDTQRTRLRRDEIGSVFQTPNLLAAYTVADNIALPLELAGIRAPEEAITELGVQLGIADLLTRYPHQLSGGQAQRVAIARALITDPQVVLADEPTGSLDQRRGNEILALLRQMVREHAYTLLLVTHDPLAASYADTVVLLADGKIAGTITHPSYEAIAAGLEALQSHDTSLI